MAEYDAVISLKAYPETRARDSGEALRGMVTAYMASSGGAIEEMFCKAQRNLDGVKPLVYLLCAALEKKHT